MVFQFVHNLNSLDLSNNYLNDEVRFIKLLKLQVLDLSDNNLTSIQRFTFFDLPNLYVLDLSNNKINQVDLDAFYETCNVAHLNFYKNLIKFTFTTNTCIRRATPVPEVSFLNFFLQFLKTSDKEYTK